jgi:hypothetical protein
MPIVWPQGFTLGVLLFLVVSNVFPPTGCAETQTFSLEIRARKVVGTARTLRVKQGETALLRWTTDEAVVLHLHGYDIETRVKPGIVAELTFKAHATGRFPVTSHGYGEHAHAGGHSETALVYIEVLPR